MCTEGEEKGLEVADRVPRSPKSEHGSLGLGLFDGDGESFE
jgi:hypothetical protein